MAGDSADYEQNIIRTVQEHGWFCTCVLEDEDPGFAYTVGFTETLDAPEFIVFGLEPELMHAMLWSVFRQLKGGRQVRDGDRWADLVEGHNCIVRAVHPSNIVRDYFNSAIWYHGDPEVKGPLQAVQIVWPGAVDGLIPWQSGCARIVRDSQPPLYLPNRRFH